MSTFTDGPAPSVTPGPDAKPSKPRADPAGADRASADRGAVDESAGAQSSGSVWLHEEIQRRIAAGRTGTVARHARRDPISSTGSASYVPRHSNPTPSPGTPGAGHPGGAARRPEPPAGPGPWPRSAPPRPGAPAERPSPPIPHPGAQPPGSPSAGSPSPGSVQPGPARPVPQLGGPSAPEAGQPTRPPRSRNWSRGPRIGQEPATNAFASTPQTPAWPPTADRWDAALAPGGAAASWDVSAVERTTPHDPAAELASPPTQTPTKPPAPASPVALAGPPTGTEAPPADPPAAPSRATAAAAQLAAPPQSPPHVPARERPRPSPGPAVPRRNGSPAPEPVQVPAQRGPIPAVGGPGTVVDAPPPAAQPSPGSSPANEADPAADDLQSRRVRVVLAERKGVARPVRTVVDIQEGTGVGELLRSNLIQSQLAVALRFAVGAGLALGLLPLLFAMFPEIGLIDVFGLRLPWLLLGFLVYPFLLGLGWWHTRTAERVEQEFADHVQDN